MATTMTKRKPVRSPMRSARTELGITALDLAEMCGTTEPRVYMLERGRFRPRPDEAVNLARVLGVDVEDLFPGGIQEGARHE